MIQGRIRVINGTETETETENESETEVRGVVVESRPYQRSEACPVRCLRGGLAERRGEQLGQDARRQ